MIQSAATGRYHQHDLLTREQEIDLARRAQAGDLAARNRLIECNIGLVRTIARNHRMPALEFDDIAHYGVLGLAEATLRFDPGKGVRFSTYASIWIRQAIGVGIESGGRLIRIPRHSLQLISNRDKARESDPEADPLTPSQAALVARAERAKDCFAEGGRSEIGYLEAIETTTADSDESDDSPFDLDELPSLLAVLSDTERQVIRLRYGLDDREPKKLREVGAVLGLCHERVRQIENIALGSMRLEASRRAERKAGSSRTANPRGTHAHLR